MEHVRLVVEEAGCASCADRVRAALTPVARVQEIEIDGAEDVARVQLARSASLTPEAVDEALHAASRGAGHAYRVRPGSWTTG